MPLSTHSRRRLQAFAVLAAPVIAVQGVRMFSDSELAAARAKSISTAPEKQPDAEIAQEAPLTARQQYAMRWSVESAPKIPKRSPMERNDPPPPKPVVVSADQPKTPRAVVDDRPSHLRLTGMLSRQTESLASIDGQLRRIGDVVAPGWRITSIDTRRRSVVLQHADGRTFHLWLPGDPSKE